MHVSQQLSKRNVVLEIKNVAKSIHFGRVVVEHQQNTRERQHDKEIKSDSAHAPRVGVTNCVAINLCRMKMQEYV